MTPHDVYLLVACNLCGRSTWWRQRGLASPWICGVCVPPLLKPGEVEWRETLP